MTIRVWVAGLAVCLGFSGAWALSAQEKTALPRMSLYRTLRNFDLSSGMSRAENLTLKRDRAVMTFNGTFYSNALSN